MQGKNAAACTFNPGGLHGAAVQLCLQVAEGMAFVHSCGLIHRDLKPANVFLSADFEALRTTKNEGNSGVINPVHVKIGDFGLSRYRSSKNNMTQAVGSPAYMAPEVFSSMDYGEKTDVFSFALIMGRCGPAKSHGSLDLPGLLETLAQDGRPAPLDNCPPNLS